jgi:uncharacterized protein YutE (UPF0331/DUF86 family)
MKERIEDKIKQNEQYLSEVLSFKPQNLKEYENDLVKKLACERSFEKIAEALVDLAILVIRYKNFESPEDDDNSFRILAKNKIISEELAKKLGDIKGMRNRLSHRYAEVDDKIVFEAIDSELKEDVNEFINIVKNLLKEEIKQ